jgi:hypothetical protein
MHMPDAGASAATKGLSIAWGGYGVSKALGAIGVHSWSEAAGMMATVWTLLLIVDFCWKKWRRRTKRGTD